MDSGSIGMDQEIMMGATNDGADMPVVGMDMPSDDDQRAAQDKMIYDMQMVFKYGVESGSVLFKNFNVTDGGSFVAAIALIMLMAILSEGFSFAMWYQKFTASKPAPGDRQIAMKVVAAVYYTMLRLLNYCQMLVAMTFNFWLILMIAVFQFVAWYGFQDVKDGMVIKKAMNGAKF